MVTARAERYIAALQNIPPSGGGGCHAGLLGVANLGRSAGICREQIADDLAAHVHGTRIVTRQEIQDAINKAFTSETPRRMAPRVVVDGKKLLSAILERGADFTEAELLDASPVRIDWAVERDGTETLLRLYAPDEKLFIGAKRDAGMRQVQTVSEWIRCFERGDIPEHMVPNPLTGDVGPTRDGKPSYRADACVKRFAFAVLEFDTLPRWQQIQFWAGVKLPIATLIDSGGKSIHAWVRIDARDSVEWTERVEEKLFDALGAVGIDRTCKNESRLSRTPGHLRDGKRPQRILYLAPEGRPVQP